MNIVELNKYIGNITSSIPIVHSYSNQDAYIFWNTMDKVRYGSVIFSVRNVITHNNITQYDCIIYYGDRLLTDKSNLSMIYADANSVLNAIIGGIRDSEQIEMSYPVQINLFQQKFADELAGGYVELKLSTAGVGQCSYGPTDNERLNEIHKRTHNIEYGEIPSVIDDYNGINDLDEIKNKVDDILE